MLITRSNFDFALGELVAAAKRDKVLSFDTETTCISWWDNPWLSVHGIRPRVFSMQFATSDKEYYFDFNHSKDKLDDSHFKKINDELTLNPEITWAIANAKFDLHHSANHGVHFAGTVHCTKAIARVVNNLEPSLSLDALCARYLNSGKLDIIAIIKEKNLITKIKKFGYNDKFEEIMHFDQLHLNDLVSYGCKDTRLCYDLFKFQVKEIDRISQEVFANKTISLKDVMNNERKITKIFFEMEREGVLIDRKYTEEAYESEVSEYRRIEKELDKIGTQYTESKVDWLSGKQLKPIFEAMGEEFKYNEKGNVTFDKEALEDSNTELAKLILKYRHHNKRAHTYFENFIWLADSKNILHADAQQAGTISARVSYWQPNLQNVPKRQDKDEVGFKVRRCIIPKPGKILVDFDYTGAEYYLSMDYARESSVIEQLKNNIDPHEALRQDMNLKTRDAAKTMQFAVLYGAGQERIGKALGFKGADARVNGKLKKEEYFRKRPGVADLIRQVSYTAKTRGYIFNWRGRVLNYSPDKSYTAPNGLIQSGVGDMTKQAMIDIFEKVIPGTKTKMILQVHDSILFEFDKEDFGLVEKIKKAMNEAYPHKVLQMQSDASFSDLSWADLQDDLSSVT